MSQRPNTLAIGAFTAGIVVLLICMILFFGSAGLFEKKHRFVMFFEGSINGLQIGAPVAFQGVEIGEVTDIQLAVESGSDKILIPVYVDIRREAFTQLSGDIKDGLAERLINRGLRAQLKLKSLLTGLLYVEFDFHPNIKPVFHHEISDAAEIPTMPSTMQELSKTLEDIRLEELVAQSRDAIQGLNKIINDPATMGTITQARQTLVRIDNTVAHIDQRIDPLITQLDGTLKNIETLSASLNKGYPVLQKELEATFTDVRGSLKQLNNTLGSAEYTLSEDSPLYSELLQAIEDLSRAAQSLEALGNSLDRNPESLLRGKRAPQ